MKAIEHQEFGDLPDSRMENRLYENKMFHMIGAVATCTCHYAAMAGNIVCNTFSPIPE
jgi:hypothetical protein